MGIHTRPARRRLLARRTRRRMRTARTGSMLLYRLAGEVIRVERQEEWDLLIRLRMRFILGGVLRRSLLH